MKGGTCNEVGWQCAVENIAQDGMTQGGKVDADLVCPPGLGGRFNQRPGLLPLNDSEMCLRAFSLLHVHNCSVIVTHICSQGMAGSMFLPNWCAIDDGVVNLVGLMSLKLDIQRPMGFRCAGKDHHAAGDFVQPVDDPDFAVLFFEQLDQIRRIWLPAIRQDGQTGGLVDDEQEVVSVKDVHTRIKPQKTESAALSPLEVAFVIS